MPIRIAIVAAATLLAVTTLAGPALAEPTSHPASVCDVTVYGHTGQTICEFDIGVLPSPDGTIQDYEFFVVGTNYAIYHIWPGSNGWVSLGGRARTAERNGVYGFWDKNNPSTRWVETVGTDNNWWCDFWSHTGWSGWQPC